MRCTRRPKALPRCHIHAFIRSHLRSQNVALTMPYLCSHMHASACTLQHLCCRMHAAEFTQLPRSSIDTVALMQQHWCCRSDSAAFMQPLARSSIFQLHLRHIYVAALAGARALCMWKRQGPQSAFSNAEHDASWQELARAGAGRGEAGGLFLKRGVVWWGGGV